MNSNFNAAYSAAFPGLNMMTPLNHMPEGMPMDNPYKNLMERIKEARDDEDSRDTRDSGGHVDDREVPKVKEPGTDMRKDLGPMPFSILPPHMLNMMERIKSENGGRDPREREDPHELEQREASPMNLSSERDDPKRTSESFPQSPSPSSGASNCQNSPSSGQQSDNYERGPNHQDRYLGSDRESDPRGPASSPLPQGGQPQIDIRAQFLAGLRRLDDTRRSGPQSPESLDLGSSHHRSGGSGSSMSDYGHGNQDNLPPRKRKVSQEVEVDSPPPSGKLNLQEHKVVGGLNGLHEVEGRDNSTIVN